MCLDSAKADFEADICSVESFHVKVGQKEAFQNEVDKVDGLVRAWYITRKVPPLPTVMPTAPIELQIIEQGR